MAAVQQVEMPQVYVALMQGVFGVDTTQLKPGEHTPKLQQRFAKATDGELHKMERILLQDRLVTVGAKDTKMWAKCFDDVSSYEIKHFLTQASEFAAKDAEFEKWFDDFTANIQPKIPQETRAILSVYFIFEYLRKRQEAQSEKAVGTVGAFVIADAFALDEVQQVTGYVRENIGDLDGEKVQQKLTEVAAQLSQTVQGAQQTAATAVEQTDVLELLAKTGASLSSALRFSVCAAGWMTEFLKSCKRNEDIVYCGTLGLAQLLQEVKGIENETQAYGARIISYYKSQNKDVTDDQLQSVKSEIETWTGE